MWRGELEPPAGPPGSITRWSRVILESIKTRGAATGSASQEERGSTARHDLLRSERRTEARLEVQRIRRLFVLKMKKGYFIM